MEEGYISMVTSAKGFVCAKCKMIMRNETFVKRLNDEKETVKGFCYCGNALNASSGFKMMVVARTRIRWIRFQECGEVLYGKRFSLKMKGKVYQIWKQYYT